jgi:hypothetical protein
MIITIDEGLLRRPNEHVQDPGCDRSPAPFGELRFDPQDHASVLQALEGTCLPR